MPRISWRNHLPVQTWGFSKWCVKVFSILTTNLWQSKARITIPLQQAENRSPHPPPPTFPPDPFSPLSMLLATGLLCTTRARKISSPFQGCYWTKGILFMQLKRILNKSRGMRDKSQNHSLKQWRGVVVGAGGLSSISIIAYKTRCLQNSGLERGSEVHRPALISCNHNFDFLIRMESTLFWDRPLLSYSE